jgi:hypothetical protein
MIGTWRADATLLVVLLLFVIVCGPCRAAVERPIIVVPGILGTKLCHNKEVVWGKTGVDSLRNFSRLDLGVPSPEALTPCGLIENINVIGPFWKIESYSGLLKTLSGFGYEKDKTLFTFPYDWRLSNKDNAKLLADYIKQLGFTKIDIVAHSMGGLVTSIYLQKPDAADHVNKVIFLATPFLGSMNVFGMLSNGYGGFENAIAGGMDTIRETVLSWPTLLELLPSYENCCRLGTKEHYESADPMSVETWQTNHWLPRDYYAGQRAIDFERHLAQSREVHEIVKQPLPAEIKIIRVAGNAFSTNHYLWASSTDPSWSTWTFEKHAGDQTVSAWSAANDTSTLAGSLPSFNVHATIFDDATVRNILERELVNSSMPRASLIRVLTDISGIPRPFETIDANLQLNAVPIGQPTELRVEIKWGYATDRAILKPEAVLAFGSTAMTILLDEVSTDEELKNGYSNFVGKVLAPNEVGIWPIGLALGGIANGETVVLTTYVPK